jgi:hypothetical protein
MRWLIVIVVSVKIAGCNTATPPPLPPFPSKPPSVAAITSPRASAPPQEQAPTPVKNPLFLNQYQTARTCSIKKLIEIIGISNESAAPLARSAFQLCIQEWDKAADVYLSLNSIAVREITTRSELVKVMRDGWVRNMEAEIIEIRAKAEREQRQRAAPNAPSASPPSTAPPSQPQVPNRRWEERVENFRRLNA